MNDRTEILLHWAAAVSVVVLGLLAVAPESLRHVPPLEGPLRYLIGGTFSVLLAGFHFFMLFECARGGRWTKIRVLWLVFMLLLPIAPAVVYFLFTRSRTYPSSIAP